jgi:hypothetical protein
MAALPAHPCPARTWRYNVQRIGTLAALSRVQVESVLGSRGVLLHTRANGIDPRSVIPPARRETLKARATLRVETNDRDLLMTELRRLAEQLGRTLRLRHVTADRLELVARRRPSRRRRRHPSGPHRSGCRAHHRRSRTRRSAAHARIALTALGLTVVLGAGNEALVIRSGSTCRAAPIAQRGDRSRRQSPGREA